MNEELIDWLIGQRDAARRRRLARRCSPLHLKRATSSHSKVEAAREAGLTDAALVLTLVDNTTTPLHDVCGPRAAASGTAQIEMGADIDATDGRFATRASPERLASPDATSLRLLLHGGDDHRATPSATPPATTPSRRPSPDLLKVEELRAGRLRHYLRACRRDVLAPAVHRERDARPAALRPRHSRCTQADREEANDGPRRPSELAPRPRHGPRAPLRRDAPPARASPPTPVVRHRRLGSSGGAGLPPSRRRAQRPRARAAASDPPGNARSSQMQAYGAAWITSSPTLRPIWWRADAGADGGRRDGGERATAPRLLAPHRRTDEEERGRSLPSGAAGAAPSSASTICACAPLATTASTSASRRAVDAPRPAERVGFKARLKAFPTASARRSRATSACVAASPSPRRTTSHSRGAPSPSMRRGSSREEGRTSTRRRPDLSSLALLKAYSPTSSRSTTPPSARSRTRGPRHGMLAPLWPALTLRSAERPCERTPSRKAFTRSSHTAAFGRLELLFYSSTRAPLL